MTFIETCCVCKNTFIVTADLMSWSLRHDETQIEFKVKINKKMNISGSKLLCSSDCRNVYADARQQANEAYEAVMEQYHN